MGQGINHKPEIAISLQYKFSMMPMRPWHFGLVIWEAKACFSLDSEAETLPCLFGLGMGKLKNSAFIIRLPSAGY